VAESFSGTELLGDRPGTNWAYAEHDVHVGSLKLHYLEAVREEVESPTSARTLLALHGMTSHGDAWRPVIAGLSAVDRVICPDMRGHGRSDWTHQGYWLADYADDMIALLTLLGVEDGIDLIGQSLGARVGMVLAPRLGRRLNTMTLCDTGPIVERSGAEQARSAFLSSKSKTAFGSEDELLQFLRDQQPEWAEDSIRIRAGSLYRRNWAGKLVNRGDPDVGWLLGRAGLHEVNDMWEGLRNTNAPTLVIRGAHSYLFSVEIAQQMCSALTAPTYLALPYGHYIPYEAPHALAAAVDTFLRQH
jgi:pimeloyl-ACP methyl ester carboxylesterase